MSYRASNARYKSWALLCIIHMLEPSFTCLLWQLPLPSHWSGQTAKKSWRKHACAAVRIKSAVHHNEQCQLRRNLDRVECTLRHGLSPLQLATEYSSSRVSLYIKFDWMPYTYMQVWTNVVSQQSMSSELTALQCNPWHSVNAEHTRHTDAYVCCA